MKNRFSLVLTLILYTALFQVVPAAYANSDAPIAMWDLQFNYDASTAANQFDLSACTHIGDEFWAAAFNSDQLLNLDNDGSLLSTFSITGVTNISGLAWDGTSVWACDNSTTIYQIDPISKVLLNTVDVNVQNNSVRFLTFDPFADNGNGGFWVGNSNTPIFLIDLNGDALFSIDPGTHTLTNMSGIAVDNLSDDGPYLWVFHQNNGTDQAQISQLTLPTGMPTGVGRDVGFDLASPDGEPGGLFISDSWDTGGGLILGGLLQSTPDRLFGYDLDFVPGPNINAGISDLIIPASGCNLGDSVTILFELVNNGAEILSEIPIDVVLNGELAFSETIITPISPGVSAILDLSNTLDLSQTSFYDLSLQLMVPGDVNNVNDNLTTKILNKPPVYGPIALTFDNEALGESAFSEWFNIGDAPFQVNEGPTSSGNTGPATDASGEGKYAYLEASGVETGENAILTSGCLDLSIVNNPEFSFSYHMFGDGTGKLEVKVLLGPVTDILLIEEGQQQINSDAPWTEFSTDLSMYNTEVELLIEATRGANFRSDIAIDEITITGCPVFDDFLLADITPDNGPGNGAIDLSVNVGTPPFQIEWSTGDTTLLLDSLTQGSYSVTVTDAKGCMASNSFDIPLMVNATAPSHPLQFSIFPNPSNGIATIDLKTSSTEETIISVWDANGKQIKTISNVSNRQITLNLNNLPKGIFFIRVENSQGVGIQKLIRW